MKFSFVVLFVVFFVVAMTGCTDADGARSVLLDQGYSNIEITGYEFFGCGEDDTYQTGFEATAPSGRRVVGIVCKGLLFKGSTIRISD